jgi:DNA polymerase I
MLTTRLNTPVQGTAADILKIALGRLPGALRRIGAQIIGTVHDEVLLECAESKAEEVKEILQNTMEKASFLQEVPIEAEAKICKDWGGK